MKTSGNNDKHHIEESLKQMPSVKDNTEKDILYQRISSKINKRNSKGRKKKYVLPVLSTVVVLALLLLIVPGIMDDIEFKNNSESSSDRIMDDSAANESGNSEEQAGIQSSSEEDSADSKDANQEKMLMDQALTSHVIPAIDAKTSIVRGAVMDSQAQYVIPLSIPISNSENPDSYYSQLGSHLDERSWGVTKYMFTGASFRLDRENAEVYVDLPDDFSVGPGAAKAKMFTDTLAAMFKPFEIDKAIFNRQIDLEAIGSKKEISLKSKKVIYKTYQESPDKRRFLVQAPVDARATMKVALSEMKKAKKEFNVSQSVPKMLDLSVKTKEERLLLAFKNKELVTINQDTVTMIDAILMTAKSFGFQEVRFTNSPYETIGPYQLSESIQVPVGANPIDINE